MSDRCLPGLAPGFIRLTLLATGDAGWRLEVHAADDPRYLWSGDTDVYEDLTYEEALDVVGAVLDGLWPGE